MLKEKAENQKTFKAYEEERTKKKIEDHERKNQLKREQLSMIESEKEKQKQHKEFEI